MKAIIKSLITVVFLLGILAFTGSLSAQKTAGAKEQAVKTLVDSERYVFYAQSVLPSGGRQRFLTTDYTVNISKDTVISDLPFFGRAYSPPLNSSEGGIKFTSLDFDYKVTPRKKGWDVSIKPKDVTDVQQLNIKIFENGTASVLVTSTNRQAISFNGYIREKK